MKNLLIKTKISAFAMETRTSENRYYQRIYPTISTKFLPQSQTNPLHPVPLCHCNNGHLPWLRILYLLLLLSLLPIAQKYCNCYSAKPVPLVHRLLPCVGFIKCDVVKYFLQPLFNFLIYSKLNSFLLQGHSQPFSQFF